MLSSAVFFIFGSFSEAEEEAADEEAVVGHQIAPLLADPYGLSALYCVVYGHFFFFFFGSTLADSLILQQQQINAEYIFLLQSDFCFVFF